MIKCEELPEREKVRTEALLDPGLSLTHSVLTVWSNMLWRLVHQERGRKRKLTETDVRPIKTVSNRDRRKTTADLQAEINVSGSESEKVFRMTICR